MKVFDLTLYFITDGTGLTDMEFLERVEAACAAGVTLVQLREKSLSTAAYLERAVQVKAITDKYQIPLIIDDRLDIAMAVDAAGVHVGRDDMPVDKARELLGTDKIIGATAKTVEQAEAAERADADYLGVGAIYPTATKVKTQLTSVETLKAIIAATDIPAAAIGGLNAGNMQILEGCPIQGICVVSAIMKAKDVTGEVGRLRQEVSRILRK